MKGAPAPAGGEGAATNQPPAVDPQVIERNLLAIIPEGQLTLTLIHPDNGIGSSKTFNMPEAATPAAEWAVEKNLEGWNVFFGLNESRSVDARSKEADIARARFCWADIDPDVAAAGSYEEARKHLIEDVLPLVEPIASVLIDSGNGLQALLRLTEPLNLGSDEARSRWKSINADLGYKFAGGGTHNADRIFRVPGTLNYPNAAKLKKGYPPKPSLSKLLVARDMTYRLDALRKLADDHSARQKASPQAADVVDLSNLRGRFAELLVVNGKVSARYHGDVTGLTDQTGSGMDMSLYAMMKQAGFSKDEISALLNNWQHGSQNGRTQGGRYWDRIDKKASDAPVMFHRQKPRAGQGFGGAGAVIGNGITAAELSVKHFPPLKWVVLGLLPEGCYLLTARPKVGKSWFALQLCLSVALGVVTLGKQVTQGKAIYLALEDNPRRLQDRLSQLRPQGYATADLLMYTEWPKLDAGGLQALEALISKHQPRLVAIDTLAKVRPRSTNSHVYENDHATLAPLTEMANRYRCCILVVHHNRKGKSETDALEQISGSLGLVGAVDGALVIDGVRSDKQYKLSMIGRDIPSDDELAISRKSNGEWEMLGQAAQVFVSQERKQVTDLLAFHPQGLKPKEIADLLGKGQSAVRKLLASMAQSLQVSVRQGMYKLPPHAHSSSGVGSNNGISGGGGVSGNTGNGSHTGSAGNV